MSGVGGKLGDDARAGWDRLGVWGMVAAGCAVVGVVLALAAAWPLVRDAVGRRVGDVTALEEEEEERIGLYAAAMEGRVRQITGRSMFFVPPAPTEAEEQAEAEGVEEGPVPKPTRYGGPDVIAVVNGTVWFGDDRRVGVGEEGSGVRVVSIDGSPWSVRLEWRGVEFDVEVFKRTTDRFLADEEDGT